MNKKTMIPIGGMKQKAGVESGPHNGGVKAEYDADGKWVTPAVY